jgi:flagellar biosynthesis chaperone FliJ
MITAVVKRFNGNISYLTGTFNEADLSTSYAINYHNPRQQTDTEFVYLTVQTPAEIQADGLDNSLIFRQFKFPDDLPIDYQPQIDELENRIDDAEEILADHENRIDDAESDIQNHENRLNSAENRLDTAENTIENHAEKIENNAKKIAENTEKISNLENKIDDIESDIQNHETRLNSTENRLDTAENTLENHTTQIENNTDKITENSEKIADLESKNNVPLTIISGTENVDIDTLKTPGEYEIQVATSGERNGIFPPLSANCYLKIMHSGAGHSGGVAVSQIAVASSGANVEIYVRTFSQNWTAWRKIGECNCTNNGGNGGNSDNSGTSDNEKYRIIKTFELPLLENDDWGNYADTTSEPGWLTIWPNNRFICSELIWPWRQFGLPEAPTHLDQDAQFAIMRRLKIDVCVFDRDDTNALSQMGITCGLRTQSDSLRLQLGASTACDGIRYCKIFITISLKNEEV